VATGTSEAPLKVMLSPGEYVIAGIRKAFAAGMEALAINREKALKGSAESIHDLRVASRRLRAAIELFSDYLYVRQKAACTEDIKWISAQAGTVRECDINVELIKDRASRINPGLSDAIAPMIETLEARRVEEVARLHEALASKRFTALIKRLSKPMIKRAAANQQIGLVVGRILKPIVKDVLRRGDKIDHDGAPAKFHKLRIRIKRLRYALEMLTPMGAKHHKKTLQRLEDLQDLLGNYNDTVVASGWLHEYAHREGVPTRSVLAAGALIQEIDNYGGKLRRRSLKEWHRFERSKLIRDMLQEIRRAGRLAPAVEPLTEPAPELLPAEQLIATDPPPEAVPHEETTSSDEHCAMEKDPAESSAAESNPTEPSHPTGPNQ
jgi:CHAD domain-containing protein